MPICQTMKISSRTDELLIFTQITMTENSVILDHSFHEKENIFWYDHFA